MPNKNCTVVVTPRFSATHAYHDYVAGYRMSAGSDAGVFTIHHWLRPVRPRIHEAEVILT